MPAPLEPLDAGREGAFRAAVAAAAAAGVCQLKPYKKQKVRSFKVTGELVAYCSPDSTYAVTKRLIDGAKRSVRIGIYDFTARYVRDLLVKAMGRGVKVELMLDLAGVDEQKVFDSLKTLGADCLRAPSCANKAARFFSVVHQKVMVIDGEWTLVQSGNFSNNSIPQNETDGGDTPFVPGNRDAGIAVRSKPLARFFSKRLAADRKLVLDATTPMAVMEALAAVAGAEVAFVAAPTRTPEKRFPSKTFKIAGGATLRPVLTPDNYLDTIVPFLESSKKSILIEQQYIRTSQPEVRKLIQAMARAKAANPDIDIRIILGKAFDQDDVTKFDQAIRDLGQELGLKRMTHVRFINQDRFVHCHNKMIIVDRKSALVSSQNWSDTAVATNREAGVIIDVPKVARHYASIFESDWKSGVAQPMKRAPRFVPAAAFATGKVVPIAIGDIVEV